MKAASYTANYQMMYLFLESTRGELSNSTVHDSLQAYITDVNIAVDELHTEDLKAITDSTYEYYQSLVNDQSDAEMYLDQIRQYLTEMGLLSEDTITFFKKIFAEIVENL